MKIHRPLAIVLLVLTLLPIGYILYFLGFVIYALLSIPENPPSHYSMVVLFILHGTTMLIQLGLLGFCLWYLLRVPGLSPEVRLMWVVLLIVANVLIMPVFWYIFIWKPTTPRNPTQNL